MKKRKKKNSSKTKDLKSFMIKALIILLVLLIAAYIIASALLNEWAPWKWDVSGTHNEQLGDGDKGYDSADGGLLAPSEHEANGVSFKKMSIPAALYGDYGISAVAETAFELTVTSTNAGGDLSDGKFSLRFDNESSSWATGKTVTEHVDLNETDSTHATVSCLQAFGEPIKVVYTFTGESDGEIKTMTAEYPLDYAIRVLSDGLSIAHGLPSGGDSTPLKAGVENASLNIFSANDRFMNGTPTYSAYTVTGNPKAIVRKYYVTDSFMAASSQSGSFSNEGKTINFTETFSTILTELFGSAQYTQQFRNDVEANNAQGIIRINVVFESDYTRYEADYYLSLDLSSLSVASQGVQWPNSGHIF